jgi:hypothetical protein
MPGRPHGPPNKQQHLAISRHAFPAWRLFALINSIMRSTPWLPVIREHRRLLSTEIGFITDHANTYGQVSAIIGESFLS